MSELLFQDGTTKGVDYNTAAKVYLIQQGNTDLVDDNIEELKALAKKTIFIDFKKLYNKVND